MQLLRTGMGTGNFHSDTDQGDDALVRWAISL